MKLSDLSIQELHTAIITLSIFRARMIDASFIPGEYFFMDRAQELASVIQVLESELAQKGLFPGPETGPGSPSPSSDNLSSGCSGAYASHEGGVRGQPRSSDDC